MFTLFQNEFVVLFLCRCSKNTCFWYLRVTQIDPFPINASPRPGFSIHGHNWEATCTPSNTERSWDLITSGRQQSGNTTAGFWDAWDVSRDKASRLTSALHSGSFTGRPGISLMAEDRLPLHEVTLLWYVTFERLASDFFSDAVRGNRKISELELKGRAHISSRAGLAVKGASRAGMLHAFCKEKQPTHGSTLPSSDVPSAKKHMWLVGVYWNIRTHGDLPGLLSLGLLTI